ncbi:cell wall-binding repeat-containing protein [Herbiconiux sp. CPCC 205763]|uniref:Cell wall-binding repeat-containing protein n=1 Tax=Herbiconiux aconitum TaxID=2970913 RepID=A0ABT2GUF2_9MICO|nr:cell wall-binding repeat-containing protein [Herbiconiux aconitum]MCS5719813.1 cell wall-binding repeat-containing protein [Herbiconiux aconitum]
MKTRLVHGAGAFALLAIAGSLLVASPAAAIDVQNPVCPPAKAVRGIPIAPTPALDFVDKSAQVSISAGTLPTGVKLTGDLVRRVPYQFEGTPTATGTSTFTVKAEFDGALQKTIACTMVVSAPPAVSRIQGTDRYDQAVQISKASFSHADTVYLASGEKFPDALSAGAVAGVHEAPLLLTPAGELTAGTKAEIARLRPEHIVVVGGSASVSKPVIDDLTATFGPATVTRIGGVDRFEVSRNLIADKNFGVPEASWVYLATGANFPDALAASPAAVTKNAPVLLVNGAETAPTAAETALLDSLGVTNIQIAGGTATVSQALQTALETPFVVTRASGADRFEAAVAVNQEFFTSPTIYLASGLVFPDALSAAPVAGAAGNPIYLVQQNCVPASVLQEVVRLEPTKIVVLGGPNTLGSGVEALKPC